MVAALGSADPSYLRMGSMSGVGNLQALNSSGQFPNNAFRSFPPTGLNVHGFPSSGAFHLGQSQNLNNSSVEQLKYLSSIVPVNQNSVHGMHVVPMGLDPLQNNKGDIPVQNLTTDNRRFCWQVRRGLRHLVRPLMDLASGVGRDTAIVLCLIWYTVEHNNYNIVLFHMLPIGLLNQYIGLLFAFEQNRSRCIELASFNSGQRAIV
ncbi:hypothetical protein PIB30_019448 [Stylosanthes scabra]|uniref:Uncharacterized protein n=1 Tax=Stylosanthes scabra TaxID=79078 RepID=A0ABU6S9K6_9FABA|nr:hypothetical protein [Stylosanthes scabra]